MNDRRPQSKTQGESQPDTEDALARRFAEDLAALRAATPRVQSALQQRQGRGDFYTFPDPATVTKAFMTLSAQMLQHPERLLTSQTRMLQGAFELWQTNALRLLGGPEGAGETKDRRFRDEAWESNVAFNAAKRNYLLFADELASTVREVTADLEPKDREKTRFYAQQMIDALAPNNFAATNPEVLQTTLRSGGENLLRGAANLFADLARGGGLLRITQCDPDAFEPGRNIAVTPGKVVYQNDLMQLIQYSPTTEQVDRRPLLIVPPWINKFYILDLTAKRSFIRWAVEQGITVFIVSWVNPDESYAEVAFEDYLTRGPLEALDAITKATGEEEFNVIGYCIGGTLLGCTLAHQAVVGDKRVRSATFFTSLLDFSEVGPLSVFVDEEQIRSMEGHMEQCGYLEGTHLANAFNLLQSRDLVWGCIINNYLLGRDAPAFDLLYWNSDSTRMPRRMHSFYLRNMYLENRLREPGGITLAGTPIDLKKVDIPVFFAATETDHIAPWRSCYRSAQLLGSRSRRFVLGGSGHIAGIVNPEGSNKYGYWIHDELPADPDHWLEAAEQHPGSWWPEWRKWLKRFSGGQVPARHPGDGDLEPIEDAPGSYVRVRVETSPNDD